MSDSPKANFKIVLMFKYHVWVQNLIQIRGQAQFQTQFDTEVHGQDKVQL